MRILQINSHYNQGGAAKIVACIHRQLLASGQESYVAYGRGTRPTEENIYQFNKVPEIYFAALFSRVAGINGWSNRWATKRLLSYIDKVQPDLIHMHALHGYYLNFPMLFAYINKHAIPCVWTFHDCHAFVGNCGYYFDCDKWKSGCGKCPHIHNYPTSQFFDFTRFMWKRKKELFTSGQSKVIVSPSDWLTEQAKQSYFGKYPCITIRNGIDTEKTFYPRDRKQCREKYGYTQDERIVLGIAVGYSDPRKGAKYIIRAARELQGEAKVILIGWEKKNDAMLEGVSNIITLPATQSADMLAEYYSMADVFVLPSLAENYATTTLEAMACGTPVVGFDAGGIPEQLTDNKGIVVKTGDQKAFTEAIVNALSDASGLIRGQALADMISTDNSMEKMTGEYMQVYQQILQESKSKE
ncbi:MAG: glycosyltransferase [Lachnospiraceae bacterium]|nr:glycosyltransferase [Lachnospiraceae bacterium]